MTLAEKILAAHSGKDKVSPGELINVKVDVVMANEASGPIAIREFQRLGVDKVFDPKKIILLPDHFTPNKDILSAIQANVILVAIHCIVFEYTVYDGWMGIGCPVNPAATEIRAVFHDEAFQDGRRRPFAVNLAPIGCGMPGDDAVGYGWGGIHTLNAAGGRSN